MDGGEKLRLFFKPGEQKLGFRVYNRVALTDMMGRTTYSLKETGEAEVFGSISKVKQVESDRFRQTEHPVSHTLVVEGTTKLKPGDVLARDGYRYYVQAKEDPSTLGIFEVIYLNRQDGNI